MPSLRIAIAILAVLAAACGTPDSSPTGAIDDPSLIISDANHSDGNARFHFLPPLVPSPPLAGPADGTVLPEVVVCDIGTSTPTASTPCVLTIATFAVAEGTADELIHVTEAGDYHVNWHTDRSLAPLNSDHYYRINVGVAGVPLGYADVSIVSSAGMMQNRHTGDLITLVDGRTLPIKFRIEPGIGGSVVIAPQTVVLLAGETAQFTAEVLDLHDSPLSGQVVDWTSSNPGIVTIDAFGLATAIASGVSRIGAATSDGVFGTALVTVGIPSHSWSSLTAMPTPRYFTSAAVLDDRLYVVGGTFNNQEGIYLGTLESYSPADDEWESRATMAIPRHSPAFGAIGGRLYAAGGDNFTLGPVAALEAYDPVTDAWEQKAPMSAPRGGLAGATLGGRLYAVGGATSTAVLATVEAYDPASDTWVLLAPMPTPRYDAAATSLNGILYVMGGYGSTHQALSTVEAYDPTTNTWSTRSPMLTKRYSPGASALAGRVHVVGGFDNTHCCTPLVSMEAYDPVTDAWEVMPAMITGRFGLGAGSIGGILYAVGGSSDGSPGTPLPALEAFQP
jgi:N-acetylneuraminic acid mutarotase